MTKMSDDLNQRKLDHIEPMVNFEVDPKMCGQLQAYFPLGHMSLVRHAIGPPENQQGGPC